MKKIIVMSTAMLYLVIVSGCGGGHSCDAYGKSDYTKYKVEQQKTDLSENVLKKKE